MDDRRGVRETYDRIAEHFSETRHHPWPDVEAFCAGRRASVAVDVGCGNGRHTALLVDRADRAVGVDASPTLLSIAAEAVPGAAFLAGDAARLPLAADVADLGIYVATLHHLPDRTLRRRSLDELARILDAEGVAIVSVWSTVHERFDDVDGDDDVGVDRTIDWTLPDGETVPRYYHIYSPTEFERDLADSALEAVSTWLTSGNCYAIVTPA